MSIDALRWAKKVKTGSSSSKSVLTWLADMCGADLCAYPSVSALAEVTELNKDCAGQLTTPDGDWVNC